MDKDVMKAIKDHVDGRVQRLFDVHDDVMDRIEGTKELALAAMLHAFADSLRHEADLWTQSKRKGWQSTTTRLREAASSIGDVAAGMEKLAAEPAKPTRAPVELGHATNGQLVYRPEGDDGPMAVSAPVTVGVPLAEAIESQGDTMAYLRGDTDVIPASLMPGANLSQQASADAGDTHPDIHAEARQMTQTFPIPPAAMGQITDDPFTDPKPPAWNGSRYIPSGGRTFSFADLLAPPHPANVPDHWSWSQLETSEGCGLQYRLSRVEFLAQIPQWANIGGDAFHKAAERIDRESHDGAIYGRDSVAEVWERCFMDAVAGVASTSPVPIGKWRVAAGGKENQDWWRVEGERMLRTFVEQRAKLAAAANPRKLATLPAPVVMVERNDPTRIPAVEWPFTITVDGPLGPLTFTNIIDRVWECADGTLLIEDLKSGSRMPKDTGQLGAYAWGVALSGAVGSVGRDGDVKRIMGTFYDARKGVWTPAVDLLAAHPWEEFVYRLHSAEAKRRAGLYTPHVTDLCVACPVQYACPMRNRNTGDTS